MKRLATLFALGSLQATQGGIEPFPEVDPYTKQVPEALARAGYVSFGPFPFGDGHTSDQIAETVGRIPLLWVETAHFKIGSSLPEYALADDQRERGRVHDELERLARRLPGIK